MHSLLVKVGRALRAIWLQAGLCLAVLVVLDLAVRLVLDAATPPNFDARVLADGYKNAPWTAELFAESSDAWVQWYPYAYWIGGPYRGRYFNIDGSGLRVTVAGKNSRGSRPGAIRVFMFGGSTMWGEGARDAYTIPSWLQRQLDQTPSAVRVTNFGQDGYVSAQEMILLF